MSFTGTLPGLTADDSDQFESSLKKFVDSRELPLYKMMAYHLGWVDQNGEPEPAVAQDRTHGQLVLASAQAAGSDNAAAMPYAVAVELLNNFMLVHEDVQNANTERNNRPTIWWSWGPAQAINAGDGLHALGRITIMRLAQRGVAPELVLRAVESLDRACLTLCEGQYMDLEYQDRMIVTSAAYFDMIGRKTGALTGCSAEAGALAAGAEEPVCEQFREMGRKLGMAWQVSRDVGDLWGGQGDAMTASNVLNKKKSLPLIRALEVSDVATKRDLGTIYMKRVLEAEDASRLVEILDQSDARQYSQEKAEEFLGQAMECIRGVNLVDQGFENLSGLGQQALAGKV